MLSLGILCLMLKIGGSFSAGWEYAQGENGPENWGSIFPECSQDSQSPIDFQSKEMEPREEMALRLLNYDQLPHNVRVINNGHTVKLEFNVSEPMYMYGGGLCTAYKLAQIHLHWGDKSSTGSEHTVNGKYYPVEFHFVHYKAKHADLTDALVDPKPDTLAVLGVWGEVSEEDNLNLNPMLKNLPPVKSNIGEYNEIETFSAGDFLPEDLSRFYRYEGSLTTPACNQIVMWTVSQSTIPISESQLNILRSMQQKNGNQIVNNYRPVQPINGRQILNVSTYSVGSGAERFYGSVLLTAVVSIIYQNI
jgi:carbonic anhydrase